MSDNPQAPQNPTPNQTPSTPPPASVPPSASPQPGYAPQSPFPQPGYAPPSPSPQPGYVPPAGAPQQPLPGGTYAGMSYPAAGYRPPTQGGGLAIAALILGIAAFVLGLVPIVGIVLGITGVVLGILAVRRPVRRGLGWGGLILGAFGALISIVTTFLILVLPLIVVSAAQSESSSPDSPSDSQTAPDAVDPGDEELYSTVSGQVIDTPCWTYDGPEYFVNNISQTNADACNGALELWGEWEGDVFVPTGAGIVAGQIQVDPVLSTNSALVSAGGDVDAFIDGIETGQNYFSQQGEVLALHEATTIGGLPANITRIDSNAADTQTRVFITVLVPEPYATTNGDVSAFLISVTTPYANGEEQVQQVLDTWEWK